MFPLQEDLLRRQLKTWIDELRSIVPITFTKRYKMERMILVTEGAFEEMIAWDEDIFDSVAKDYDLTLDDDFEDEEL